MNDDYVTQLRQACVKCQAETVSELMLHIDEQTLVLSDLLELVNSCLSQQMWQAAVTLFRKALAMEPNLISELERWLNLPGMAEQKATQQALIDQAVSAQTRLNNLLALSLLYRDCELFQCAEHLLLQLAEQVPSDIRVFHRLISVYIRMQRYHDAIACCQLALKIDANSLTAHYNMGIANASLNRHQQALASFMTTVKLDPNNQWAHIHIAQQLLKQGDFELGWRQYQWRKAFYPPVANDLAAVYPQWDGQPISGKSLLVWADQGLGDIVMFASLLPKLQALGCRLSVMAEARLKALFERSFTLQAFYPQSISADQQQTDSIDYQIPISELGARFIHDFADFPQMDHYLQCDRARSLQFKQILEKKHGKKCKVAFSWRGGLNETRKFARHIALPLWQPLLCRTDCVFINLQYDSKAEECRWIESAGGDNVTIDLRQDVDGVAALLTAVDLLISVDNSTAHLAGALGVPVWNLLPYAGEWRWFSDDKRSIWYPSMRLWRQHTINDWQTLLADINDNLSTLIDAC